MHAAVGALEGEEAAVLGSALGGWKHVEVSCAKNVVLIPNATLLDQAQSLGFSKAVLPNSERAPGTYSPAF